MSLYTEILGIALFFIGLFFIEWFLVWLVSPGSEMDGY
jgi:hypothetical protein